MLSHDPLTAQDRISQTGGRLAKTLHLKFFLTNEPPTEPGWQLTSANAIILPGKPQTLNLRSLFPKLSPWFQGGGEEVWSYTTEIRSQQEPSLWE